MPQPPSATTTCKKWKPAASCPTNSPTAPPPSAPTGSNKASPQAAPPLAILSPRVNSGPSLYAVAPTPSIFLRMRNNDILRALFQARRQPSKQQRRDDCCGKLHGDEPRNIVRLDARKSVAELSCDRNRWIRK